MVRTHSVAVSDVVWEHVAENTKLQVAQFLVQGMGRVLWMKVARGICEPSLKDMCVQFPMEYYRSKRKS